MRTNKQIVLWVKPGDPPSERATLAAQSWKRFLPPDLGVHVCTVNNQEPEVSRVPCLTFLLNSEVVYSLEGDITLTTVRQALRRLG